MGEVSFLVIVAFIGLLWVSRTTSHIPKRGRDGKASGDVISAIITNENKKADHPATLCAEKDGRKFKVKMKPTEAHLWIKGDSIDIIMNEDGKNYRVLFNDYFRQNESRIRKEALKRLEKVPSYRISSTLLKYKKEDHSAFEKSGLESQQIFAFETYMRMIDVYTIITAFLIMLTVVWFVKLSPGFGNMILPLALIVMILWSLYNSFNVCDGILKKARIN